MNSTLKTYAVSVCVCVLGTMIFKYTHMWMWETNLVKGCFVIFTIQNKILYKCKCVGTKKKIQLFLINTEQFYNI